MEPTTRQVVGTVLVGIGLVMIPLTGPIGIAVTIGGAQLAAGASKELRDQRRNEKESRRKEAP